MSAVSPEAPAGAPVVILGSGLAGYTLARELRKRQPSLPVTMITRDAGHFYSKPTLSNALAAGKRAEQLVVTPAPAIAAQLDLTLWAHTEARSIDLTARTVQTSRGPLAYRALVLAIGADPIRVPIGGDAADRVLSVNDLDDYRRLREALADARHVSVIGAGLIGCEFANDLRAGGFEVDVIDPAPQPLGRLLPAEVAKRLADALAARGVRWHLGRTVASVSQAGERLELTLSDGVRLRTDGVLSAVGLRPRIALAERAGLKVARGIVTDRRMRTSAPDVYALGDCAEVDGHLLPYVMPIMHAARALAATLAGEPSQVVYPAMPVVVKTPACPLVVSPPAGGATGQWVFDADEQGIDARFVGAQGELLGIALCGAHTTRRAELTRSLPALIGAATG